MREPSYLIRVDQNLYGFWFWTCTCGAWDSFIRKGYTRAVAGAEEHAATGEHIPHYTIEVPS